MNSDRGIETKRKFEKVLKDYGAWLLPPIRKNVC